MNDCDVSGHCASSTKMERHSSLILVMYRMTDPHVVYRGRQGHFRHQGHEADDQSLQFHRCVEG